MRRLDRMGVRPSERDCVHAVRAVLLQGDVRGALWMLSRYRACMAPRTTRLHAIGILDAACSLLSRAGTAGASGPELARLAGTVAACQLALTREFGGIVPDRLAAAEADCQDLLRGEHVRGLGLARDANCGDISRREKADRDSLRESGINRS